MHPNNIRDIINLFESYLTLIAFISEHQCIQIKYEISFNIVTYQSQ
jgi:hypothetical protein